MTSWENIKDSSPKPERVWLSRSRDDEEWKPLRISDCVALNINYEDNQSQVYIEGGRATANLVKNEITYNFFDFPKRQLASAIWFQKIYNNKRDNSDNSTTTENNTKNAPYLMPITSKKDELIIENLYKQALKDPKSTAETKFQDENTHKAYIAKIGGLLSLRKRPTSNLQALVTLEGSTELQRGYGNYTIKGEEEEMSLGPVKNLVFVIHGVGEAVWSRDDVSIQGRLEEAEEARNVMNKKMYESWKKDCKRNEREGIDIPPPPNRIELIPVTWFEEIHSSSSTLKNTLLATTIQSIPKLRLVANDVVFDVLMYLTPAFCEKVLKTVTRKICSLYERFQTVHSSFIPDGGSCSLVGHSLGSVICWDLLSVLQDNICSGEIEANTSLKESSMFSLPSFNQSSPQAYQDFANESSDSDIKSGSWGPNLEQKLTETIPFTPKFTMFLGSPLGMFLSLRGAHSLFNDMRLKAEKEEEDDIDISNMTVPSSPFSLPSGSIYNIFSSSDPVAYRIEPLLLPPNTPHSRFPPPEYLVPKSTGMRNHMKARAIGENIMKMFTDPLEKLPDLLNTASSCSSLEGQKIHKFALGGESSRVDYQLQPSVVENEYLSAISAHATYFTNDDILAFLIQCANED